MRARLRASTSALHGHIDAVFPRGLHSLDAYRRYLLGMHRFVVDYETTVDTTPRKSAWLASDLQALGLLPLSAVGRCGIEPHAATRLGWDYVLAGSSLGARTLLGDARRLGFDEAHGAQFLLRHAADEDWPLLQQRLRAFDPGDGARMAQLESGAIAAFTLVRDCLDRSADRISEIHEKDIA